MSDIVEIRDSIPDIEQIAKDIERYHKAGARPVQSGIAMLMNHNRQIHNAQSTYVSALT